MKDEIIGEKANAKEKKQLHKEREKERDSLSMNKE